MSGTILSAAELQGERTFEADVCVIGSGAGGATLAAGLCAAGLRVVMLEEGSHRTRADFNLREADAYPMLYQDRGTRATVDGAITLLQGRSVGGGTTVNWTTCYRTPARILKIWAEEHGVEGLDEQTLAPHWEAMERRLNIQEWPEELANANNRKLLTGARALGWEVHPLRRNVKGCANSGYCGLGCRYDAKQGMLLTTIPDALEHGLTLLTQTRATHLVHERGRVSAVRAQLLHPDSARPTGAGVTVRARIFAACGGAVNTPALLLRSAINPNGQVGLRTFLHPVVAVLGLYAEPVEGWAGAPQSIGSKQHVDRGPDRVGYFLETPPLQPMLAASGLQLFGGAQAELMRKLPYLGVIIAICVDGLHPDSPGGRTFLRRDGRLGLDYPVTPALVEAFRDAHLRCAELSFAAGAQQVATTHPQPRFLGSLAELGQLEQAPYGALEHAIFTAHQLGGCAFGSDPQRSVVDMEHRVRGLDNLFVVDGSVMPTSLGVNPSLSIYGLAHRARRFVLEAAG